MEISEFTVPELDKFRTLCNFTEEEERLFNLRSRKTSIESCAEIMNLSVSATKKKSQKVNAKIKKILNIN